MNNDIIFDMGIHTYIARVEGDETGGYTAYFPSLPGCHTQGKTIEETISMAKEALTGYLLSLKNIGKTFPLEKMPSSKLSKINIPLSTSVS